MSFIKDLVKSTGNEYASVVSDGVAAGDVDSFVDGRFIHFNALLSGSLKGGLPKNKITALAGESALVRLSLHWVWSNSSWKTTLKKCCDLL